MVFWDNENRRARFLCGLSAAIVIGGVLLLGFVEFTVYNKIYRFFTKPSQAAPPEPSAGDSQAKKQIVDAIAQLEQQIIALKEGGKKYDIQRAGALGQLVGHYYQLGNIEKVRDLCRMRAEIFRENFEKDHFLCLWSQAEYQTYNKIMSLAGGDRERLMQMERKFEKAYEKRSNAKFITKGLQLVGEEEYPSAARVAQQSALLQLLENLLQLEGALIGKNNLLYARHCLDLGNLYVATGNLTQAEAFYKENILLFRQMFHDQNPPVANGQEALGLFFTRQRRFSEAEILLKSVLNIRQNLFGAESLQAAISHGNLAALYRETADYASAETYQRQAIAIMARAGEGLETEIATGLSLLGTISWEMGNLKAAEEYYTAAYKLRAEILGPGDPATTKVLFSLANLYLANGKVHEADRHLKLVLEADKKNYPENHEVTAQNLVTAAQIYSRIGDFDQALTLIKRSLDIRNRLFGDTSLEAAKSLHSLAICYHNLGDPAKSELYLKQTLAIMLDHYAEDHPEILQIKINLAAAQIAMGKLDQAEQLISEVLKLHEQKFGDSHPDYVFILMTMADCLRANEKYDRAQTYYEKALQIFQQSKIDQGPIYKTLLNNYGLMLADMGNFDRSFSLLGQALEVAIRESQSLATLQSEQQQLLMSSQLGVMVSNYLTVAELSHRNFEEAYKFAITWKGAATLRQRALRLLASEPEIKPLFQELQHVTSQLARLSLSNEQVQQPSHDQQLAMLSQRKEVLEKALMEKSSGHKELKRNISVEQIQNTLPPESVLIDYYVIYTGQMAAAKRINASVGKRLVAFVLRPGVEVELVDLCSLKDLDTAIANYRNNLDRSGPVPDLGNLIWNPLTEYVDQAELVFYSPIGALGTIPFSGLPGSAEESYLIEEKKLVMIPQPQLLPSLLETERDNAEVPAVLALGGVNYETITNNEPKENASIAFNGRRAVRWQGQEPFTALPETRLELSAVRDSYQKHIGTGKLKTLKDNEASEAMVKKLAPQFSHLHFATHGFFAPPEIQSALDPSNQDLNRSRIPTESEISVSRRHPGLLSGLALAGANNPPDEGDDGIWTAAEVATTDLSNVDLAVLSACDTGLGQTAGGEGLLGLQRAFQVSGAGTTVASLWQVEDAATRTLMEEFYRNLWEKKLSKIDALREAQLSMIRNYDPKAGKLRGLGGTQTVDAADPNATDRLKPFYWAAWVLSGDWR